MKVKRYILLNALVIWSIVANGQEKYFWSDGKQVELHPIGLDVIFSKTKLDIDIKETEVTLEKYYSERLNHYYILDEKLSKKVSFQSKSKNVTQRIDGFTEPNGDTLFPTPFVILKIKDGNKIGSVLREFSENEVVDYFKVYGIYVLQVSDINDVFEIANAAYLTGLTDWCRPGFLRKFKKHSTHDKQYYLHNKLHYCGAFDKDVDALEAWEISLGCSNVRVAVLDDGVEDHPDLNDGNGVSRVMPGYSVPGTTPNGRPNSNGEHGQACAGIIAASHNQNIRGIAPEVLIVPVNLGFGLQDELEWYIAMNWAWDPAGGNADVLSNSWGPSIGATGNSLFIQAIQNAQDYGRGGDLNNQIPGLGSIVVFSSGNNSLNEVSDYAKNSIAVGAINRVDQPASVGSTRYTNVGPNQDLMAYGGDVNPSTGDGDIRTLDRSGSSGYTSGNYTNTFSGTSAAAPMVSGGAALILSINPNLKRIEVEDILFSTATDLGNPGKDNTFGYGKLNLKEACLKAAKTRENISDFYMDEISTANLSEDNHNIRRIFTGSPGCGIAAGTYFADVWRLEKTIPNSEVIALGDGLSGANPNDGKYWINTQPNGSSTDVLTFFYFIRTDMSGRTINKWVPLNPHNDGAYRAYITNPPDNLYLSHTINASSESDTSASESINLMPGFDSHKGSIFCTSITVDLDDLPLTCTSNPSKLGKKEKYIKPISSSFTKLQFKEEEYVDKIKIYPNPNSTSFNIEYESHQYSLNKYEVITLDGRLVLSGALSKTTNNIKHNLVHGVYILKLYNNHDCIIKKIVIE